MSDISNLGATNMRYLTRQERKQLELLNEPNRENYCPICIEHIKIESRLENCIHKFCFECIHCWATQSKNLCPMCK